MNLKEVVTLLRNRWMTIGVTTVLTVLAALGYSLLQTPLYQASTRLFVSTTASASASDLYQSNRYSQERVVSYSQLLTGETLAQRTIDRLGLNMSAPALKAKVTAKAKPNTVLIDVSVLDESPVRARDIANALSDEFVGLAQELETPADGGKRQARVIVEQRASIPQNPVVPKTIRNTALGLFLGLMLGTGLALIRDRLDNTVKDKDSLEEITGAGTVGYIPFDKKLISTPTISFDTDNSVTAEAFRKIRTNLQFLSVDSPPRLIVVTSASPSEGKSTTAVNLALAIAEADQTVVLVDGDFRRPRLSKYLDLVGGAGFSSVLSGGAALDDVIQSTKFPRLSVLAAGPIPPNPSELLGSRAAKNTLDELRKRFDYVILDSSPLLAVTDGAILAVEADGTLIAARAGKTKREHLIHAVGALHDVGATVLGAVLTMIPTRGSGSYSYSYYYSDKYAEKLKVSPAVELEAGTATDKEKAE